MEILFVWFYKEKIIEEQGFNFSPEYEFKVEKNGPKYVLTCNHNKDSINFFKLDKNLQYIQNITAIVGENGTGKTTLLQGLYRFYLSMNIGQESGEYKEFFKQKNLSNRKIMVIKENDNIIIYHNIPLNFFENKTKFQTLYDNLMKNIDLISNITRIYCTNSSYNYNINGYGIEGKLSTCCLDIHTLEILTKNFYKNLISISYKNNKYQKNSVLWRNYNNLIISTKKANDFQQLCDVLYYKYLNDNILNKNIDDSLIIYKDLHISSNTILDIEGKWEDKIIEEKQVEVIFKKAKYIKSCFKINDNDKDEIVLINLYFNLILELIIYNNILDDELEISLNNFGNKDKKEKIYILRKLIKNEIKKIHSKDNIKEYFIEANNEIKVIEEILTESISMKQTLPKKDIAYCCSKIIEKSNKKLYGKFLDFISDCFNKENSFILKYISIGNLQISSGERACLNIFSWIHLMPQFSKIDPSIPDRLKDNVLILIDELDLYMHPEWQRKVIKILINELENQFKMYKIQVILATHSPLVLSDIPKQNIIYLKNTFRDRLNNKCIVDESKKHKETLGRDVYTLLDDAFYLEQPMGDYAKQRIDEIIEKIRPRKNKNGKKEWPKLKDEEAEELKKIIEIIGNDILKTKLMEMLGNCNDLLKKQALEKQKQEIEKELKLLSEEE